MVKKKFKHFGKKSFSESRLNISSVFIIVSLVLVVVCGSLIVSDNSVNKINLSPKISINEENGPYFTGPISPEQAIRNVAEKMKQASENGLGIVDRVKRFVAGIFSQEKLDKFMKEWSGAAIWAAIIFAISSILWFFYILSKHGKKIVSIEDLKRRYWMVKLMFGPIIFNALVTMKKEKNEGKSFGFSFIKFLSWFVIKPLIFSFTSVVLLSALTQVPFLGHLINLLNFSSVNITGKIVYLLIGMLILNYIMNAIYSGFSFFKEFFHMLTPDEILKKEEENIQKIIDAGATGAMADIKKGIIIEEITNEEIEETRRRWRGS
jgi:hypothetical protein